MLAASDKPKAWVRHVLVPSLAAAVASLVLIGCSHDAAGRSGSDRTSHATAGTLAERSIRTVRIQGSFRQVGQDVDNRADSTSVDYFYYGPLTGWEHRNPVTNSNIRWMKHPPQGDAYAYILALGTLPNGCGIGVERLDKAAPVMPVGARLTPEQVDFVRAGKMQLIQLGVSCDDKIAGD
jgi:hypothetical protein